MRPPFCFSVVVVFVASLESSSSFIPRSHLSVLPSSRSLSGLHQLSTRPSRRQTSSTQIASLRPLRSETADKLVPLIATPEQLAWLRGKNQKEVYEQFIESSMIAFVGLYASYFASFMVGSGLSTIAGTLFITNGLLRPYLAAYTRSRALRGGATEEGPSMAISAALFTGRVANCSLKRRRQTQKSSRSKQSFQIFGTEPGYTPRGYGGEVTGLGEDDDNDDDDDEHKDQETKFRSSARFPELDNGVEGRDWVEMTVEDSGGRALSVTVPFRKRLRKLAKGMSSAAVVFADVTSSQGSGRGGGRGGGGWEQATELYSATDVFVAECDAWVGPYPYLDRSEFRRYLQRLVLRKKAGMKTKRVKSSSM